ncbi:MAG: 2-oxo acid dehydrogenase subunit E2 [Betaproteobacteria bacterium]|nr:2-oxo acid dehydrogenase subunit E2 [Betaproteobacteria bacterium]
MTRHTFKLPDVGEGTTAAEITKWHVKAGDSIVEDAPLVDVATDKAVVEIPSPFTGVVVSIHGKEGDSVPVGTELVVYETAAAAAVVDKPAAQDAAGASTAGTAAVAAVAMDMARPGALPATLGGMGTDKPFASPAVRRRARELGLLLQDLRGSGPGGRILQADIDAAVTRTGRAAQPRGASPAPAAAGDGVEEIRVIGIRRRIAEQMQESKRRIPHFSYVEEVDMTALQSLRNHLNDKYGTQRPWLSFLPFVVRALVRTLPAHAALNARYDDEAGIVRRHRAIHVGIATQTPNGLLVPVLRDAQALGLWECAAEIARLADRARAGKASREELGGSTITLTSLGAMGGIAFTPIINYPEVAIIGMNKLAERPVVAQGRIEVRSMMNLSSSFDHRVVDGWDAAVFVQALRNLLEQPATLFIEEGYRPAP